MNVGQNVRSWDGTRVLQSATPNMVRRWMARPLPFLDDFVVVSKNGVLQRMDRQDVEGLHSLEDEEVYVVVKEPELYLEHQSDETKIDKAKSDQILDYLVGASAGVDAMTICGVEGHREPRSQSNIPEQGGIGAVVAGLSHRETSVEEGPWLCNQCLGAAVIRLEEPEGGHFRRHRVLPAIPQEVPDHKLQGRSQVCHGEGQAAPSGGGNHGL